MLTGRGMTNITSEAAVNRKPRRLFGRLSERKNPVNAQFERQVAQLESRQQQRCIVLTVIPLSFYHNFQPSLPGENGNTHPSSELTSPEESLGPSSSSQSSPPFFVISYISDESHRRWPYNSSRLLEEKSTASDSMPNSEFIVNSITKPSVNARHTTRRKSKKKNKKQKQRCRKQTGRLTKEGEKERTEVKCRQSNGTAPTVDVGDSEDLILSPKRVGDILFEENFSPSSSVKEASEEAPESENDNEYHCCSCTSVSSATYCDDIELCRSKSSCHGLLGLYTTDSVLMGSSQETCHVVDSMNCVHDHDTMLNFRDECGPDSLGTTECGSCSSGVDENCLKKSDYGSGICSQNGVRQCNRLQAAHVCSDTNSDSDFHLVISKKRARKTKKMSLWKSYGEHSSSVAHGQNEKYADHSSRQMDKELSTGDWSHRQNHAGSIRTQRIESRHPTKSSIQKPGDIWTDTQNGVLPKDSKLGTHLNCFTSLKENSYGNSASSFSKAHRAYLNIKLPGAVQSRESNPCEMRSKSFPDPSILKSSKSNGILESGKLSVQTIGVEQNSGLQDSVPVTDANGFVSELPSPCSKSTDLVVGCATVPSFEGNCSCKESSDSEMHLVEMIKFVNDAYKAQIAADVHFSAGYPITNLESFIHSATPVVSHVPCIRSSNCSWDQEVRNQVCHHDIPNISLRSIWEWYEEPGCYGLEVRAEVDLSSKTLSSNSSEFVAYFVPYLSAIQLFGWCRKNMDRNFGLQGRQLLKASNSSSSHPVRAILHKSFPESDTCFSESSFSVEDHGEFIFEYFETDQPSFRPPLFEKIKDLVGNANVSDHRILGDPDKLQNMKLRNLHPASWYCVAWYPVYRVPRGNFCAAFLTYHSLGKFVPRKCSQDMNGEHNTIVSPVVGLQSYNGKGEQWFQLRCPDFKLSPSDDASNTSRAEIMKERLRTLKMGALSMSRAVIPNRTGESVNRHPDYEFFLSRCT